MTTIVQLPQWLRNVLQRFVRRGLSYMKKSANNSTARPTGITRQEAMAYWVLTRR